jgi:deoxycytidylate deaminase
MSANVLQASSAKNAGASESWELVVGLVSPIGTDVDAVYGILTRQLAQLACSHEKVHIAELLHEFESWNALTHGGEQERYEGHIAAANRLCKETGLPDALARLAVGAIRKSRKVTTGLSTEISPRRVYVLRSLKRPAEVTLLRQIYGASFLLIACHAPRPLRVTRLAESFLDSLGSTEPLMVRAAAEELVSRDDFEGLAHGQNVRATFPQADLFVNAADLGATERAVGRFLALILGHYYTTPRVDEYCMYHAQGAALRSADLSRQVGAVIASERGDIVTLGTNEVPRTGGGQYWEGDEPDERDFRRGSDSSMRYRRRVLADALRRLGDAQVLNPEKAPRRIDKEYVERLLREAPQLRDAMLMDALEYGRSVHAEMAALTEAARRGASVEGCTLYTTTFPCHECARHIVASGIKSVVYVQPYPKSAAEVLFSDSIGTEACEGKVIIRPFVGVAPRQYQQLFTMTERKSRETGDVLAWDPKKSHPRAFSPAAHYLPAEITALAVLGEKLAAAGIKTVAR